MNWRNLKAKFHFLVYLPIWGLIACRRGNHKERAFSTNEKCNFCEACGAQLNPDIYHWWQVQSTDGSLNTRVAAINAHHARSFFLGEWHPSNLTVKYESAAKSMTVEDWRISRKI